MLKGIFCLFISLWINVSFGDNVNYYMMNPKKMQHALALCPKQHPKGVSCEQLTKAADHMNELAMELRMDPLAYGQSIIRLQETIAAQIANSNQSEDLKLLNNKQALAERLTIIKLLESPEVP